MSDEILINACESDEVVIYDEDGSEEVLLSAEGIVIIGSGSGGGNADTLGGQSGGYYRSRANHTGTQAISTVSGLQTALDTLTDTDADLQSTLNLKLDAADYNDRFLGLFASVFDLEAAYPTANAGDYAQVDFGIGVDVIVYAWDVSDAQWSALGSGAIDNTDALPEGSSNLYHTSQRVRDTPLTGLSTATATPITAADSVLSAAGKLQAQISATAAKADAALAAIDAFNPANLSDAGTLLPNDQLVIWRDGVMLRTTVAAFGGGSEPTPTQLMLIPTGAVESADGEFQRFVYDGTNTFDFELQGRAYQIPIWYADLPLANRQSEYQISLKMPDLVEFGSARLYLVDADFDLDFFLSPSSLNHLLLQLRPEDGSTTLTVSAFGNSELSSSIVFTQPAAGSVISLTLNTTEINYALDGGSGTLPIPDGFFSNPPNVLVFSSGDTASHIADLSVRVADQSSSFIW